MQAQKNAAIVKKLEVEIDTLVIQVRRTNPAESRKLAELRMQIRLREAAIAYIS